MILLTVSVIVLACFIVLYKAGLSDGCDVAGLVGGLLTGVFLFLLVISIPITRAEGHEKLARLKAFRESVQRARADKSLSEIERAAILSQIVNWNEWLASERYWKGGMWDLWHVDEVLTTEDLK